MRIRVRLFASLREAAGQSELSLDLPDGATVEDAWRAVARERPPLASRRAHLSVAVDQLYSAFDTPLQDGAEVVFLPPVSGG